jgi:hypothetical protein
MRYRIMQKASAPREAGAKPSMEMLQRVGGRVGEIDVRGLI